MNDFIAALGQLLAVLWEWMADGFRRATRRRPNTPRPQRTRASSPRKLGKSVWSGFRRVPTSLVVGIALTYFLAVAWVFTLEPIKAAWEVAWNDPALLGVVSDEALNARFLLYMAWPIPMLIGIWIGLIFYSSRKRRVLKADASATTATSEVVETKILNLGWLGMLFAIPFRPLFWLIGFSYKERLVGRKRRFGWNPWRLIRLVIVIIVLYIGATYRPWGLPVAIAAGALLTWLYLAYRIEPPMKKELIKYIYRPAKMGAILAGIQYAWGIDIFASKAERIKRRKELPLWWIVISTLITCYPLIWVIVPFLLLYLDGASIAASVDLDRSLAEIGFNAISLAIAIVVFGGIAWTKLLRQSIGIRFVLLSIAIIAFGFLAHFGLSTIQIDLSPAKLLKDERWWGSLGVGMIFWLYFIPTVWRRIFHVITHTGRLIQFSTNMGLLPDYDKNGIDLVMIVETVGDPNRFGFYTDWDPKTLYGSDSSAFRYVTKTFADLAEAEAAELKKKKK